MYYTIPEELVKKKEHWRKIISELVDLPAGAFLFMSEGKRDYYASQLASAFCHDFSVNLCIKLLCKLNLYFLTKCVLRYWDLNARTHLPVCRHIQNNLEKSLLVIPRGYFKTTIATKATSIFLIINDSNIRILIANATATNGEAFLREIKAHFESNVVFRALFSELIPEDFKKVPWASDKMQVRRTETWSEPTIRTIGIEGNITGMHFNVIIEDDLVNEDHITSPEMMQKPIDWHKMSPALYVPDADKTKKMNVIVGTRWSYFDFINYVMTELPEYEKYVMSCFNDKGESTFPEKYPLEELEKIRASQGPQIFSCQYLNNPLPGEIAVFKEEWLKYYDKIPADRPMRTYMLVDPAISEKKTADNRAVIVVGVFENMDWYILDYIRGIFPLIDIDSTGNRNLVSEIFRLYSQWKPDFVGVEEVGFQKALSFLMTKEMRQRNIYFAITRMIPRSKQTKVMRIETLAAPFAAGRVYMKEGMKELKEELLGFPMARYKDLIDALSYLTQYEVPPSEPVTSEYNPLSMSVILKELRSKNSRQYPFDYQLGRQV